MPDDVRWPVKWLCEPVAARVSSEPRFVALDGGGHRGRAAWGNVRQNRFVVLALRGAKAAALKRQDPLKQDRMAANSRNKRSRLETTAAIVLARMSSTARCPVVDQDTWNTGAESSAPVVLAATN